MAIWDKVTLKTFIDTYIRNNGNKSITGNQMNTILTDIVDTMITGSSIGYEGKNIHITGDTISVIDNPTFSEVIKYESDLSLTYDDRSLVDKAYLISSIESFTGTTALISIETSIRTGADISLAAKISSIIEVDSSLSTNVSSMVLTDSSLNTALSSEVSTRTGADSSLNISLSSEVSTRTGADSSEVSIRTSADSSLSTKLSSEISTRTGADSSLNTALSSEVSTRTGADTSLMTAINGKSSSLSGLTDVILTSLSTNDTLIYNGGITKWVNEPTIDISTNLLEGQLLMYTGGTISGSTISVTGVTSLATALSSEISIRTGADLSLSTKVSSMVLVDSSLATYISNSNSILMGQDSTETATRISADSSLTTKLSQEVSTRTGADSSLNTALSSEVSTRTGADSSLNTALSNEVSTRTGINSSISTNISSMVLVDSSLNTAISSEVSNRISADISLYNSLSGSSIGAEESARISADSSLASSINNMGSGSTFTGVTSLENSIKQPWIDINRTGFMNQTETSISFNDSTLVFTLSGLTTWSYYRNGIKYTITGNKTITLPSTTGKYFITINSTDGTLSSGTTVWSLGDYTILPVAIILLDTTLTPKYHLMEERHSCLIDRKMHKYLHETRGSQFVSGGGLNGVTIETQNDLGNVFGISETIINDEDISNNLIEFVKKSGTTLDYNIFNRYNSTGYTWVESEVPFKYYGSGYIEYDLNGVSTSGSSNNFYNMYLLFTNINSKARFSLIQGRSEFTSLSSAQDENPSSFDFSGFSVSESVIGFQITFQTSNSYSNKGKCRIAATPKKINVSTITNIGVVSNDLTSEISIRTAADLSLTTSISSEISIRTSADASLATAIGTGGGNPAYSAMTYNVITSGGTLNTGATINFTTTDLFICDVTGNTSSVIFDFSNPVSGKTLTMRITNSGAGNTTTPTFSSNCVVIGTYAPTKTNMIAVTCVGGTKPYWVVIGNTTT